MQTLTLNLDNIIDLSDEQFFQLCQQNREIRLERNSNGAIIIMPPTGSETGRKNADLLFQLSLWNRRTKLGEVFDSSSGFTLPNGATRSPDASWMERSRWQALTPAQREVFAPICPDFALELLSPSDTLFITQAKLREYIDNGCQLGWLLDRQGGIAEIYRADGSVEVLTQPRSLSGESVLPGFSLDLSEFWQEH